jgi:hypothetical protein
MKRLVAFALLAILGMCSIGSAQARLAVPHIPLQPPQAVQPQIMPALLSDKCDLCVSVLTAIAKLASLNNTQVHHLAIEFSNPPPHRFFSHYCRRLSSPMWRRFAGTCRRKCKPRYVV